MSTSHFLEILKAAQMSMREICLGIWTYMQSLPVNWQAVTGIATSLYAFFVFLTLLYIHRQLKETQSTRKREAASAIFKELQTKEARDARRYIYRFVPISLEGIGEEERQTHLEKAEEAMIAFDRIGYLIKEGHIDPDPILIPAWSLVWRCWNKSENLVRWAGEKRNAPYYLEHFRHLFEQSESHRKENNFDEPRFY